MRYPTKEERQLLDELDVLLNVEGGKDTDKIAEIRNRLAEIEKEIWPFA